MITSFSRAYLLEGPILERRHMKFILFSLLFAASASAQSQPSSGRWDGTIVLGDLKVPFSMQLDFNRDAVSGTFINGEERVSATQGSLSGDILRLTFQQYESTLEAKIANSSLKGNYGGARFGSYGVEGWLYCACGAVGEAGADISGAWALTELGAALSTPSRLVVQRKGSDTIVHLLHPEDTNGELTGLFDGLSFMLHHFDGVRASLLELEPRPDGTLDVTLREPRATVKKFHAIRDTDDHSARSQRNPGDSQTPSPIPGH
jgi:hypothetical protein